jgi:hypothetical protein
MKVIASGNLDKEKMIVYIPYELPLAEFEILIDKGSIKLHSKKNKLTHFETDGVSSWILLHKDKGSDLITGKLTISISGKSTIYLSPNDYVVICENCNPLKNNFEVTGNPDEIISWKAGKRGWHV